MNCQSYALYNLNIFLSEIKLKKQYLLKLKGTILKLLKVKEKIFKNFIILNKKKILVWMGGIRFIIFILKIRFSISNTFLSITDNLGNPLNSYSSGDFNFFGKRKKARFAIFTDFYKVLVKKILKKLRKNPVALHFVNVVGYLALQIIFKIDKKLFVQCIESFDSSQWNGCRKSKMRRLKSQKNGLCY